MLSLPHWAQTALGTPLSLHASHSLPELASLRPILLMGGVHGDEPEGVWLAEKALEFLRAEKRATPWVLIPCLNPDGIAKGTRVNGRGVDLNRNYPAKSWSPHAEKERYFPGPHAGSEPEIQAFVKLLAEVKPRLVIHCHSWEPCVVYSGEPARRDAERLAASSGYEARAEIGYPTPGALSQFGWVDHKIPVICIEERSGTLEPEVWPHFARGIQEIFLDPSPRT